MIKRLWEIFFIFLAFALVIAAGIATGLAITGPDPMTNAIGAFLCLVGASLIYTILVD